MQLRSTAANRRVWLLVVQDFLITERSAAPGFIASPVSYIYQLLDCDENDVLAYHWLPHGRSTVTEPHLHLSNQMQPIALGRGSEPLPMADLHLATGLLTLAGVVRMLIAEFGVEPLAADWLELLSS